MSRHSKNNTAGAVFTYGERKMIAKEYGTLKQRVGQDSQKEFERCYICLQKVKDPKACTEGHLFCNDCIIESLVTQKKKLEVNLKEWERQQQVLSARAKEEDEVKKNKQIEDFEKSQVDLRTTEVVKNKNLFNEDAETQDKSNIIQKLKTQEDVAVKRPGMIKDNFWMPENNKTLDNFMKEKPSSQMICPGDNKHNIKLKQLVKATFDEAGDKFVCWICKKELKFQKICMLPKCGHAMCKSCLELTSKTSTKCPVCNQNFKKEDIINMKEAQSAFSAHNKVVTEKYTPSFTC